MGLSEDEIDVLYGELREQKQRDEALLRQALEALESADWYIGHLEWIVYSPDDTGTHYVRAKVRSTIAALREQLGASATGAGQAEIEALQETLATLKAENEMLREVLKDADNELDWLDEEVGTCDHSVWVCVCSYWGMRRKMKAALASQRGNADIALLVFAVVCAVWLVIAGAMGWLPGCGL